jgi:hypothetical protein
MRSKLVLILAVVLFLGGCVGPIADFSLDAAPDQIACALPPLPSPAATSVVAAVFVPRAPAPSVPPARQVAAAFRC